MLCIYKHLLLFMVMSSLLLFANLLLFSYAPHARLWPYYFLYSFATPHLGSGSGSTPCSLKEGAPSYLLPCLLHTLSGCLHLQGIQVRSTPRVSSSGPVALWAASAALRASKSAYVPAEQVAFCTASHLAVTLWRRQRAAVGATNRFVVGYSRSHSSRRPLHIATRACAPNL